MMRDYEKDFEVELTQSTKRLLNELNDIELTESEVRTIQWLSGWSPETCDNVISIFNKIRNSNKA